MKLGIFVTHPVQYHVPIWRRLAKTPGVDLVVHFFNDYGVRSSVDPGFGVAVTWDVPLLEGYEHRFLSRDADLSRPRRLRMERPEQTLGEGGFDAVMVHGYIHGFERQVIHWARRRGVRSLIRGEFSDVSPFEGRSRLKTWARDLYLRWLYRRISAFCAIGHNAREHLLRLGVDPRHIFWSPYSVDTDLFQRQRESFDRAQARRELGIPQEATAVLFSGKLIPRKAPDLVLSAVERLENNSKVYLVIVGDGEMRARCEQAGRRILGQRLIMPGFVNQGQLGRFFMAADVFVLPSWYETWGLVVNEAMEFGLPVIVSTGCGCHRDLVVEGQTGRTFSPGNAAELAERLGELIRDPRKLVQLGTAARAKVAEYGPDATVDGILAALGIPQATG